MTDVSSVKAGPPGFIDANTLTFHAIDNKDRAVVFSVWPPDRKLIRISEVCLIEPKILHCASGEVDVCSLIIRGGPQIYVYGSCDSVAELIRAENPA